MALFDRLTRRVADRARELVEGALERTETAFSAIPDVKLRREGDTLVIKAMGLARRWIGDVGLRFALWRGR